MCVVVGQTAVMHHRMGWGPRAAGMLGEPEWGAMVEGWGGQGTEELSDAAECGAKAGGGEGRVSGRPYFLAQKVAQSLSTLSLHASL